MFKYQKGMARLLAEEDALFFADDLFLKDGRSTPYFVNMGKFFSGSQLNQLGWAYASMFRELDRSQEPAGILPFDEIRKLPDAPNGRPPQDGVVDVVFGPSYKGSLIAQATVTSLWNDFETNKLVEYDRKEAKEHGDGSKIPKRFVTGAFYCGARIAIVDDVATTMATKYDALDKIDREAYDRGMDLEVRLVMIGVDREQTQAVYDAHVPKLPDKQLALWKREHVKHGEKGEDAIQKFQEERKIPVFSVVKISDALEYLAEEKIPVLQNGVKKPLMVKTMKAFKRYQKTYGVK